MLLTLKPVVSILWFLHCRVTLVSSCTSTTVTTGTDGLPVTLDEDDYGGFTESEETTTASTILEKDLPLDLYDLGYVGTWDRFCDSEEIKKEFPLYPYYHVLKQVRETICNLRRRNEIDKNTILSFAVYKYCDMMRTRVDGLLKSLISKFSSDDETKRMELLDEGPLIDFTDCYKKAIAAFRRKCMGDANPYFDMFKPLIGRACFIDESYRRTDEVMEHIDKVCNGKWISDQIDWDPILASIKFRDHKRNTTFTIRSSTTSLTTPIVNNVK